MMPEVIGELTAVKKQQKHKQILAWARRVEGHRAQKSAHRSHKR